MQPSLDRPLPLRMRPDLVVREQWFRGRRHFVIKDPLRLSYSYLTEQEHAVLAMLDGRTSAGRVLDRFAERFAPQQLTGGLLQSFLMQLHRQGLVLGEAPGQGAQLAARRERSQFQLLRWDERILAIRWRGIDPEPLLARLNPLVGWLFSAWGLVLWLAVVVSAVAVVVSQAGEIQRRLPDALAWLSGNNLLWLAVATMVLKTLHELGHALAARRVGARCREIGLQLFFLLPCLYTNVSDVWLVPSKWRRIAVSAAGIYIELLLAALAAFIWWQAEPGVISSLALNVMLVASLGTLILNGNPLMRYDGYYILSDLIEVPNLEERSRSQLVACLARWCLGVTREAPDGLTPRLRPALALYAGASLVYRAAVLIGVYLASRAMLAPWRLEPLSDVLLAGAILGMIVPLATEGGNRLVQARRQNELRPLRVGLTLTLLVALLAAVFLVPLPQRVTAPVVIEPRDAGRVFVTVAGTLVDSVAAGTQVEAGQVVARLESPELKRDLARLESETRQQALYVSQLETTRGDDPAAASAIPSARQSLADLEARLGQVQVLRGKLELAAPRAGVVLQPPHRAASKSQKISLPGWTGTPLDAANRGSFLETGTLVCLIAGPGDVEAVAIVEQSNIALVQPGKTARVATPAWPRGVLAGKIEQVARVEADDLPLHLTATGAVQQQTDAHGVARPLQTTYQVRIRLDEPPPTLLPGATGRVQIDAVPQPLATRLLRWLGTTFRMNRT